MSGNENLGKSWEIARLSNELKACKDALSEMYSELLDSYDSYDKAEAEAYWSAKLNGLGIKGDKNA